MTSTAAGRKRPRKTSSSVLSLNSLGLSFLTFAVGFFLGQQLINKQPESSHHHESVATIPVPPPPTLTARPDRLPQRREEECNHEKIPVETKEHSLTSIEADIDQTRNDPILKYQVEMMNKFLSVLDKHQHPADCTKSRMLVSIDQEKPADGFAREVQENSRFLETALATDRVAIFQPAWYSAYCPFNRSGYTCLWQDITSCSYNESVTGGNETLKSLHNLADGIEENGSNYFNAYLYGDARVRTHRKWPWGRHANIDNTGYWERSFGRFWVRSMLSAYVWKPQPFLQEQIQLRTPHNLTSPYIGFHIRFTDNRNDLKKYFGRNAVTTRNFKNFMRYATEIKEKTNISNIYISSDFDGISSEIKRRIYRKKFTFYLQTGQVDRGSSKKFLWFMDGRSKAAASIATDLDVLRKADYLVGSHQSNVFRLACQLNTAYHVDKYPYHVNRYQSVDVEWFEDP